MTIRIPFIASLLCLSACQQGAQGNQSPVANGNAGIAATANASVVANGSNATASNQVTASTNETTKTSVRASVPAAYDWNFVTHGGSGDLDFGDGDWSEGVSLLALSCTPSLERVSISWAGEGPAQIVAGRENAVFQNASEVPLNHPLLRALRSSGTVSVTVSGKEYVLAPKPAGKQDLEDFLNYCGMSR